MPSENHIRTYHSFPPALTPCREPIQIAFAIRENYFRWLAFRRLDACYPNEMPAPATRLPIGTIATARDSWSRMVLLPRLRAPGQQQAQALVSQRASFSSQSASSASPPAGPREPGWARAAAEQLRPPPPDAPTPSAAGSPLARASRKTRYQAGLRADRA